MMVNLFPIGNGFAGQMSVQLSEGRGGKFSGFTEGGVSSTPPPLIVHRFLILHLIDSLFFAGEALETGQLRLFLQRTKRKYFGVASVWGGGQI
jgi:hypothetical protein